MIKRKTEEWMTGWSFAYGSPENFRPVVLPHDWVIDTAPVPQMERGNTQGYRDGSGIGWYRKEWSMTPQEGRRYFLDFDGVMENSTLWVNGQEAGGRKYGYSPFRLEITSFLREGENELLLRVDASAKPRDRWYSGAGIYRTVRWIETGEHCFSEKDIVIRTAFEGDSAWVEVETGLTEEVHAVLEGVDEGRSQEGRVRIRVPEPHRWSAEDPYLYTLRLETAEDTLEYKVGLRSVELRPGEGLYINGVRTILRGVCVHQDIACRGIAAKKELWEERLHLLKRMGCNAIRPSHHVYSREFLDLCDTMGFYVYEECFDKWKSGSYARYYETEHVRDVEAMICRDRNRPSILFWGVGNEVENQGQDSMLEILGDLTACARRLDPTRPVSYAMNPHFKKKSGIDASKVQDIQKFVDEVDERESTDTEEVIERIRRIGEYVDFISGNYQEQRYELIHQAMPDKLILGTEVYQYFLGDLRQLQNYNEYNPALVPEKYPYVMGGMIWTGVDYLGEAGPYPSKGWTGSPIQTNGVCRPMYYWLKSYWNPEPMVHFAVMDYSLQDECTKEPWNTPSYAEHWQFPQFQRAVIPYRIATNCDEVRVYLDGKCYYPPRPERNEIRGFLPWKPGVIRIVGYRQGKEVCEHKLVTPGPAIRLKAEEDEIRLKVSEGYEKLFRVEAVDREDQFYFRESTLVRFSVEGPAKLAAVDNGDLTGSEPYVSDRVHLYHGRAAALLRFTGESGRVVLTANAEGMYPARVVINIEGV